MGVNSGGSVPLSLIILDICLYVYISDEVFICIHIVQLDVPVTQYVICLHINCKVYYIYLVDGFRCVVCFKYIAPYVPFIKS